MNKKLIYIAIGIITIFALGYFSQTIPSDEDVVHVSMINNQGEEMGIVQMSETKAGVLLNLELSGLSAGGEHAIHIHEKGDCTPLESFTNAGGHYNPHSKAHGMKHPEGQHAGDMPNLKPDAKGAIKTQILNRFVTLNAQNAGERASVFDADGSAIVIHAQADDHMSQPSGAAGDRISCGVIQKP